MSFSPSFDSVDSIDILCFSSSSGSSIGGSGGGGGPPVSVAERALPASRAFFFRPAVCPGMEAAQGHRRRRRGRR